MAPAAADDSGFDADRFRDDGSGFDESSGDDHGKALENCYDPDYSD